MINKKIVSLSALLSIVSSFAIAESNYSQDPSIKLSGEIHPQYGVINQSKNFRNSSDGKNQYKQNSLSTSGSIKLNYDKKTENNLGYGGLIKLNTSTSASPSGSSNIASEVKIYFEGNFGKFEVGTTSPVGSSMEVNSYSLARATGGLDGDWDLWLKNNQILSKHGENYYSIDGILLTAPKLPVGFDETTKANKINYFSPNINGFTFGLSFTPESKANGTVSQTRGVDRNSDGYKNIWQPAVRYEKSLDNGVTFATALLGEFGKAKDVKYYKNLGEALSTESSIVPQDGKRHNLSAWQIGASIGYNGFAFSGSYGDIGKSGTLKDDNNSSNENKKGGKYWSLGSAYSTDKYGISINYMQGKRAGALGKYEKDDKVKLINFDDKGYNKFHAISVGADYQIMPGFMPYVEVTRFKVNKNEKFTDTEFNKGTVILAGTKIKF